MSLLLISFFAGMLSVLAPCVLPVLPVILGGSLGSQKRYRPLIIVLSTAVCIVLFTLLLKVSTALIGIPQSVWTTISSLIIVGYGVTLIWPSLREGISHRLGGSNVTSLATRAKQHQGIRGDILLGASLGPIFASCSPTYAILLSVVFPKSILLGIGYTLVYALGFALLLAAFAYGGRQLIKKFSRAANPTGIFKKILGGILVITGILIATGWMKKIEVAVLDVGIYDVGKIEQRLLESLPGSTDPSTQGTKTISSTDTSLGILSSNHPGAALLNTDYPAPEIAGLDNWINGGNYRSLSELRGKVVVLDFWTYSCINCIRTLETLKKWHSTYADKGLVIIGVHAPEFQFEKKIDNVKKAVKDFGLEYPVVQDNDFKTRQQYNNRYRPAKYIIDKQGRVRYTHFGEGEYEQTEQVIQYLLGVDEKIVSEDIPADYRPQQTAETYLGEERRANFASQETSVDHMWWLSGTWKSDAESILMASPNGSLTMNVFAASAYLVMDTFDGKPKMADIYIDGVKTKTITIDRAQKYDIMTGKTAGKHRIEVRVHDAGLQAFARTFG